MRKGKSRFSNIIYWIAMGVLFLYAYRHIALGVDLWDTGYNYTNFTYADLDHMDSMWFFATWGANAVGHLLTLLPYADTLLGMNLYTTVFIGLTAAGACGYCVRKLGIPIWLAFAAELLALSLCWAPSALLYHYLTYGLLMLGACFLYTGLTEGKKHLLLLAGILLGLNVGIRFSNLVQAGLIVLVWYAGVMKKQSLKKIAGATGWCILGYASAVGAFLLVQGICYGITDYWRGITRLFSMTASATDYKAESMLLTVAQAYYEGTYWLKRFALAGAAAAAVWLFLPRKLARWKKPATWLIMAVLLVWLWNNRFCYPDYAVYASVYDPCIVLFSFAMGMSLWRMLEKGTGIEERLRAMLLLLLLLVGALGSNNGIYSTINNLFLVLPLFFSMVYDFCKGADSSLRYPLKVMLLLVTALWAMQSFRFGTRFVYEEADGARTTDTVITQIPRLEGMRTSAGKAEQLEELYGFLKEQDLLEHKAVVYGNIPGLPYYMGMEPAMNVWSDLRSYMPDVFADKLKQTEGAVIILEASCVRYLEQGEELFPAEDSASRHKLDILGDYIRSEGYEKQFHSEKYAVYLK